MIGLSRVWSPIGLFVLLFAQIASAQQAGVQIPEAAAAIAPKVAKELIRIADTQGRPLKVGVFAFGDEQKKVDWDHSFAATTTAGEIAANLRNEADRKFIVLDPFELKSQVAEAGADPAKLKTAEFELAAAELRKMCLDAAVIGTIQSGQGGHRIHADVLFADGAPLQVTSKVDELQPVGKDGSWLPKNYSSRFEVELLVDNQPVPMYVQQETFLAALNRKEHFHRPFKIRILNRGMPPVGWIADSRTDEKGRYFTAAVYVDGVNSIYEEDAEGKFHASQQHPDNVTKWVIGQPGWEIQPGYHSTENPGAQSQVDGSGSAELLIPGFQKDSMQAATFVFANAGDSLAHEIGVTKQIGEITVYFYSEKMDGDDKFFGPGKFGAPPGGVIQGPPIQHQVFGVTVETHPDPVEVWRIKYRYFEDRENVANAPETITIRQAKRKVDQEIDNAGDLFRPKPVFPGGPLPFPGGRGRGRVGSAAPR